MLGSGAESELAVTSGDEVVPVSSRLNSRTPPVSHPMIAGAALDSGAECVSESEAPSSRLEPALYVVRAS